MAIFGMIPFLVMLCVLLSVIFAGIWVYQDARAHGENGVVWLLVVVLVPNLLGLVLYFLMVRRNPQVECKYCGRFNREKDVYCSNCGEELSDSVTKGKGKNTFAILALVSLGLAMTIVIGFITFGLIQNTVQSRARVVDMKELEEAGMTGYIESEVTQTIDYESKKKENGVDIFLKSFMDKS